MSLDRSREPQRSFILPVYNAELFLLNNLNAVRAWLSARPEPWELIIVDDASTDSTSPILDRFLSEHEREAVVRVRFTENRGKGFATRVGLGLARGSIPSSPTATSPIRSRTPRRSSRRSSGRRRGDRLPGPPQSTYMMSPSFFSYLYTRHLMGRLFNVLCRVLTVPRILDTQAGLKGFRTEVVRPLLAHMTMDGFSFDVELLRALIDRGARIVEIPVSFRYDSEPSTVQFIEDSARMLRDLLLIRFRSLRGHYRNLPAVPAPAASSSMPTTSAWRPRQSRDPGESRGRHGDEHLDPARRTARRRGARLGGRQPALRLRSPPEPHAGRPVLPPEQCEPGRLEGRVPIAPALHDALLRRRVRMHEIRKEWRAQIARTRSAGVAISHLDSHQHVHLLPRIFARAMAPLARHDRLSVRVMDGPIDGRGPLPTRRACSCRWPPPGAARRFRSSDRGARLRNRFMRQPTVRLLRSVLSRAKPGRTYEFVVHPGRVDPELRSSGDTYSKGGNGRRPSSPPKSSAPSCAMPASRSCPERPPLRGFPSCCDNTIVTVTLTLARTVPIFVLWVGSATEAGAHATIF